MDLVILKIFAFVRPLMFMDMGGTIGRFNLLEIAGIGLTAILVVGLLAHAAILRNVRLSVIDLSILAFVVWCIAIYIVYFDKAYIKELTKVVLPILTYIIAKNAIHDETQYRQVIWLVIVGFAIPIAASAILTLFGERISLVNYWTGEPKFMGAFTNSHDMAHYSTLVLMLVTTYVLLSRYSQAGNMTQANRRRELFLAGLSLLAVYCLYQSSVRTAMLGLFVYCVSLLVMFRKRLVAVGLIVVTLIPLIAVESVQERLIYEVVNAERDTTFKTSDYASGRPRIWAAIFSGFADMPLDRQVAGIGIGNGAELWKLDIWGSGDGNGQEEANRLGVSHNDYLEVLVQTGFVGLALFVLFQLLVLNTILKLERPQRYIFLALFIAVTAMNFGSASYVTRFGIAQIYYIMLAYIELPRRRTSDSLERNGRL